MISVHINMVYHYYYDSKLKISTDCLELACLNKSKFLKIC